VIISLANIYLYKGNKNGIFTFMHTITRPIAFMLLLALLAAPCLLRGQTYFVVQKTGRVKNFKYKPGNTIIFQVKGELNFRTASISRLYDSTIVLDNGSKISLQDITKVRKPRTMLKILSTFSFGLGVGYLSIDVVNNLINGIGPVFNQETLLISGILVGSALIMRQFSDRTLTMGPQWRLIIVDLQNLPSL
jgi:hypothetical protein